ncbi:MAG: hypothetical protein EPN46_03910 [Candidimonas sp.]|nr:MAG: hypothetical protein EPN77_09435 [Candidimonas sp.]TAM26801.1 MAG: hypothetical protein EPN62_01015 [Candidimonas sp.]TAM79272.1 MAG: hypothetical protein EPN46_03910 [Candidimonas sp.]
MKYQIITPAGLAEISDILRQKHKTFLNVAPTAEQLSAWAAEAEFQLGEGNPASIEIKARDHINGWAQDFNLSAAAVEWAGEDDEDEAE